MKSIIRYLCMMAIAMMPVLAVGQSVVVDTVPYFCDFEDSVQNSHWHLVNGTCYNYFVIDTATNTTPDGTKSLYVTESDQTGHPYSYKPGSSVAGETSYVSSRVFAWLEINFPDTGLYDIGFWWNCMGEVVYDYGRIILAPTTYTFTASTADWDTSSPYPGQYLGAVATPSNCISLNGSTPLSNVSAPQYRTQTVHITTAGNYRLGIMWLNDGNTGSQPPLMIDDIAISPHVCDAPSLMVDHFSNDTVYMTWGDVAPSYVVMWDTAGVTSNFAHVDTIYTNGYVIGGLPENGEYEMIVAGLCSGTTSMQTSYHIVMPDNTCAPITSLPYTINFDTITSIGSSQIPPNIPCWGHLSNSTNQSYDGYPYISSSYAHSGTNTLYFYYYYQYLSRCGVHMPRLDNAFDITGVVVSFWAANGYSGYHPRLMVGVMSDPSNLNSFVACDTLNITSTTTTQYFAPLSNYMGHGQYVAVVMCNPGAGDSYGYCYVDDIVLSYEPCSRPGVTSLVVTDTSAHIEWAPTNGYYYEWTMSLADTATVTRENDTMIDLTGLSPSTQYTFYIRSVCDDPGAWNPVTFRTECGPVRALPFFDDLEGSTGGTSTTPGSPFVECWKRVSDASSTEYPYISTGSAHSGSRYVYWYRSNTAGSYGSVSYIVMPGIDTNYINMNNVVVKFWAMSSSTSYGPTVEVGVMNSQTDTASFRRVAQVDILDASYRQYSVPLANYTDTGTYVALRARHNGQYWYGYFDDFSLESIPSCPQIEDLNPVGVGTTSAYVSWGTSAAIDSVSTYEITVIDADSIIAPITFLTTETGYFVTGLAPHTSYTISVRAVCDTSYSEWSSVDVVTNNLPCIEFDTSTRDSLTIGLGMGSTTAYTVPLNNFYNYSYTQQLISASEMGGAAVITGIDFQYGYSSPSTVKSNCTIYLSNTAAASLSSSFVPYSASTFTNVYTGALNCVNGWNHFEFTTPFAYDGTSNLLITVHDNSGIYNSSSYVFNCHSTSGMTRYLYTDTSPYTLTSISGGTTASYRSNMRLHTQGCGATGNCASPNVIVDNVAPDEISIIWAAGSTETSWNVEYQAAGDTAWIDEGTLSSSNYTFTGLNSNTTYNIRVTALCSSTEAPTATVSATTTCDGYPIPFFEDFSTWGSSSTSPIPACWYRNSTYNANYPYTNSSYNHSGSPNRAMYFYNSGSLYSCIILPKFNVPVDSLEISFYMLKNNTSYPHALRVGVMTDPNDMSTFELIEEVQPGPASMQWYGVAVPLNSYTGHGEYIAIRTAPGYNYPYVDDISVTRFNPCVRPSNFSVDNVVSNSATIHWEDTLTNNFEVEWGPMGFTRGTGTTLTTTEDSVVLTGLAVNTQYDIYVRGICTEDTGYWTMPFTFWSECLRIDSLPFVETFESSPTGDSYNPEFVHCWTRLCGASYFYPYVSSSSTYNHTPGGNRGMYWYCTNSNDYYYGNTMSEYIVLPEVDTTVLSINNLLLSFWATQSSSTVPYIAVGVMSDPSDPSTFVAVDTVVISAGTWNQYDVSLGSFNGYGSYIALRGFYVSYWYAYVDDISLDVLPSCMKPNHLSSTGNTLSSVDLAWNERAGATEWQIAYDTAGASTPAYDTIVTLTPATTIGGLFAGQTYTFRVRSICSVGDTSDWSDPINAAPGAWNMRPNVTDTLRACQAVIYDDGGPDNQYSDGQSSSVLIIYPDTPGRLINISGSYNLESCCDYINVYDGSGTGGTQLLATSGTTSGAVGPFLSTSGPMTIQFHTDGSVHSYDGFEIYVSCISTTCGIFNLSLDTTTAQSATQLNVTWDTNGALVYEVEYGPHGFIQGTGTSLTTTVNHVIITGLDTLTSYDVYVRSICADNDTGSWSRETFTTSLCENSVVATNCNGDGTTTTSYFPGYATYEYSYSEVIIDSADMAGSTSIIAWAFKPTQIESGSSYHNNCTVYMAHTTLSDLSTSFIQDTATFQKVFTGSLNHSTTDWQVIRLDSSFVWDGHSNVVVAVDRRHGSWTSSGYFAAFNASSSKARYIYQDNNPYNIGTISGGYATSTVPVYRFFSCGGATCEDPIITSIVHDHSTATVTWIGGGTEYEVNIKESVAPNWPATNIAVTGTSYTFTGLTPSTNYMIRVRQNCTADSIGYSDWVIDGFLTDNQPCLAPDSLHITDVTNATADFSWSVNGNENAWDIHVWYGSFDSIYRVITHPVTVGGFTAGLTYNAAVRAVCGTELIESDWSDTVQFTTATCPDITGLTISNVTTNSVTLNWDANPMALSWHVEYGPSGFTQGQGVQVTSNTNSYVVTGLSDGLTYDFYVKAVCGDNWTSENWVGTTATTQEGSGTCDVPTNVTADVNVNNVNLSWTPGEGNTSFEIEYGDHGFSHGNGHMASTSANSYALTGLGYNTQYDVYVRGVCEENTYSDWSAVTTFTTGNVSIDEVSGVSCTIYPNPTSSATTISVIGVNGTVRIAVVDMNGRTVATETLECSADCEKTMEVDKLAQGAYFVRITADNTNMVKKLIVR